MVTFNFTTGVTPDDALVGLSTSVPILPIMFLVFTWFIVFFGGVQRQSNKYGYADIPQWATLSSLSCVLLSLVMTTKEGIIALPILLIVISLTILSAVWFFLSRGRYE